MKWSTSAVDVCCFGDNVKVTVTDSEGPAMTMLLGAGAAHVLVVQFQLALAEVMLQSTDIVSRETAVHSLERLGGPRAMEILGQHNEVDLMLDEYISRLVKDLAAEIEDNLYGKAF